MRVLFTTPILEHPAAGGPQLRIENSIKALSRVCELDIISGSSLTVGDAGKDAREFYRRYCHEFSILPSLIPLASSNRYVRKLMRIARRLRRVYHSDLASDVSFILDHVDRRNIDVIWFGYGNISYPLIKRLKEMRPALKVVCDTDSVWSRFLLRELPYATGSRKQQILQAGREKEAEERAWVDLCDVTTAVSEVDAEYYRGLAKDSKCVHLFSNVIDPSTYLDVPPPAKNVHSPSIYLAGTFWPASPMENAARWVIEEVLSLVRQSVPDVNFYIVGKDSDKILGDIADPKIIVTGKLLSVLPYLCHMDVALVPLKFESGTRFKILEAGACKIPLVSTTLGAEGIPVIDGEHILIADEPAAFANAIIRLLNNKDLANRLANNCHNLVNEHFSVEFLAGEAKRILEYLDHDRNS
jgi:glycosyltransferase involved in cell wall biosynthesis